jgi:hypothetical protein
MIVVNVRHLTLIVATEHAIQKLENHVVLAKQIVVHAKVPVIGMVIVNLNILKM